MASSGILFFRFITVLTTANYRSILRFRWIYSRTSHSFHFRSTLIRRSKFEANIFRGSQVISLLWSPRHITVLKRNCDIRYIQWYSIWTTVELGYDVMKGIFCVVINEFFFSNRGVGYNVRVTNQELFGTTQYLTLWTSFRINQCRYSGLDSNSIILTLGISLTSNQCNVVI